MTSSGASEAAEKEKQSHEDRFVHYAIIPSLQTISSFQVALSVWHSYILHTKNRFNPQLHNNDVLAMIFNLGDDYGDELFRNIDILKLPSMIEDLLKKCLSEILKETKGWINVKNFLKRYDTSVYQEKFFNPNCFVWFPNGKIDEKNTAAMICRSSALNEVEKFIMMCEYCLEDQLIETFAMLPLLRYEYYKRNTRFANNFLFDYWHFYLTNKSYTQPLLGFNCVDAAMAAKCDYDVWSAFEYFWNRLNFEDQIEVARSWLRGLGRRGYAQHLVLSKMSWYQQRALLDEIPRDIIFNFFVSLHSSEGTLWAWNHSKYKMTADEFLELVSRLKTCNKAESFLALIWDTVPDHLRDHVIQFSEKKLDVLFHVIYPSSSDFALLCKYYPLKIPNFWKNLILNNVSQFANYRQDPSPMNQFVKLSLPNADDLSMFKKSLASSENMKYSCLRLIGSGGLELVDQKLKFCCCDLAAVRKYKLDLLTQTRVFERGVYFTDVEKWYKMSVFIDDAFDNDQSLALSMKKKNISLYAHAWPNKNDSTDDSKIDNMMKIIEMVCADDDNELRTIKKAFSRSFLRLSTSWHGQWREKFASATFFRRFVVKWCLSEDENTIREFKNNLPLDIIFNTNFNFLKRTYEVCGKIDECTSILADIDFFLKWYYDDIDDMRKFKLKMVAQRKNLRIFDTVLKLKDDLALQALNEWAFEGDLMLAVQTINSYSQSQVNVSSAIKKIPTLRR